MEQQSVTVEIMGRSYKLTIPATDEKALRNAAQVINEQAKLYGKHFNYKDHQDLLTMAALSKVTELIKIQENLKYKDKELIEKLTEIDSVLEAYLHPAQNSL